MQTLNNFLKEKLDNDLGDIILSISNACSLIEANISKVDRNKKNSNLENFTGDIQKEADILSNNILYSSIVGSGKVSSIISEENQKNYKTEA